MPTYLSPGVYVEEVEAGSRPIEGVGTAVAAFVGLAEKGPFHTPTLVSNWSQFNQTFGEFVQGSYLAHSVYGYFLNGGGNCYVVRIGGENETAGGKQAPRALPAGPQAVLGGYRVVAKPEALPAGRGGDLSIEVADGGDSAPDEAFTLVVKRGSKVEETLGPVTTKRGKENIVTVVREKSKLITIEEITETAAAKLEKGTVALRPLPAPKPPEPEPVTPDEYVGDVAKRTGFGGLEAIDEVTMVAVPDLMTAYRQGVIDLDGVKTVQTAMVNHCELMGDRMAVLDPPPGLNAQQVRHWRQEIAGYDSKYAALYYPWVQVFDPPTGTNLFVPPAGHMAGVWARNDASRGVHKAPANELVRGAVALETQLTRVEQELLNPIGVNCIRSFPGRGIRVWGARTLSSDAAWRYLNVRRLFNYLEESILNGTQWVVFEPNDYNLWARIKRTISAFLINEWYRGALFGRTPEEAFFVKCDDETNSAESIDAGQVVCEVGVAPVKPAEFVIFRLSQFSGGVSQVSD